MYLIQHPTIKGDSSISKFKENFKVQAIDFTGGKNTIHVQNQSTRPKGTARYSTIKVTKEFCKASIALQEECNFGKPTDMKILFLGDLNQEYLEITLIDAVFSEYEFIAHGGRPLENFEISYTSIYTRYIPRDSNNVIGTPVGVSYNLIKGCR
jgi:type VI protein secretion system component Hcp